MATAPIAGAIGEPHDQADDLLVEPAIARVINAPGQHGHVLRLPGGLAQKLAHVGVALCAALFRLARHGIDGQKNHRLPLQNGLVLRHKAVHLGPVPPVANTGPQQQHAKCSQIQRLRSGYGHDLHRQLPLCQQGLHTLADAQRLPIGRGVNDQNRLHQWHSVQAGGGVLIGVCLFKMGKGGRLHRWQHPCLLRMIFVGIEGLEDVQWPCSRCQACTNCALQSRPAKQSTQTK